MVKTKAIEASQTKKSSKRKLRTGEDTETDICHDFEDNILETSRDSAEVDDEISINPADFREKISYSPKDAHLKPERWKYKSRKKRKKSDETSDDITDDAKDPMERVIDVIEENSVDSVENSVDFDLQEIRKRYLKMNKTERQSFRGIELYNKLNCVKTKNGLDSTGNSETQSSSDDAKRKIKPTWKVKTSTAECDVCGKEMLKSRLKKHVRIAHKCKRLYPCDECSFNAEKIIELKKHLRKIHKLSTKTVRKMIKLMKLNRKHRLSVLEDEPDLSPSPVTNDRVASLGSTIMDELHQSDSDLERKTRAANRTNYKELSFDDDDWKAAMADTDSESDSDDDSADKKVIEESNDSGRETQTHTEQSGDEVEKVEAVVAVPEEPVKNDEAIEELLKNMRTLTDEEKALPGAKFYSKEQKELLWSYYQLSDYPSNEHRDILSSKVGIEPRRVYYWFDNTRRTQNKIKERKNRSVPSVTDGGNKRIRKPRASSPVIQTKPRVVSSISRGMGTVVEYDESQIIRGEKTVEETVEAGEAVCIGIDITPSHCRCLLCNYTCNFRGNLYKHLRQAHDFEPKFCAAPRSKSELAPDVKGCRKTFSIDTFDLHTCTDQIPTCFGDEVKLDRRCRTGVASSCYSSDSEDEPIKTIEVVENLRKEGKAVCLAYEVNDSCTKCLLCDVSAALRGNLYKHINSHGYNVKFCCAPREKSELEEGNRGCRKIFLDETFDEHTCTNEPPEQLGHFPLEKTQKSKKKTKRGGYRGFEKNFGTPDGSPAKFYNDRYTRLFHQLAIRTNIGLSMDSTFVRNGKMELCYLSDRQMSAVKDYLDDNDKFILVRIWSDVLVFYLFICHNF